MRKDGKERILKEEDEDMKREKEKKDEKDIKKKKEKNYKWDKDGERWCKILVEENEKMRI